MTRRRATRPELLCALVLAGCTTVATACGSSGRGPQGSGAAEGPLLKLAECMRANGVPSFPDPRQGVALAIPNDIDPASPAFVSAQHLCARYGSAPASGGPASASDRLELLRAARCMRRHGLPSFPDPTTSPPPPPAPGTPHGNVIGGHGVYLALPAESPAFTRAATECRMRLP